MSDKNKNMSNQDELLDLLELDDMYEEVGEPEKKDDDQPVEETEEIEETDETTDEEEETEEEEQEEDPTETSVILSVMQSLGYEPSEDEEFTDDEDGLAELTRKHSERLAQQYLDEELSPIEKEFRKYVKMGGDPNFFLQVKFPDIDYTQVEFNEEDEDLQTRLVKEDLVARGYKGEELKEELNDIVNGGILKSKAKRALESLKQRQIEEKYNLVKRQEQEYQQQVEQDRQYWTNLEKKITESKAIKDVKIPEADKKPFFNYISKPVKDGKSQRILDGEQLDEDTVLLIDYLIYKKFDFAGLVNRKAKDLQAKTLRDRIRQAKLDKQSQSRSNTTDAVEELADIL